MITLNDLKTRFDIETLAKLSDRKNYQVINKEIINTAIQDAVEESASYLLSVGLVSFTNGVVTYVKADKTPDVLVRKLCDMAMYYLHDDSVTEIVEKRYNQAIAWHKQVMQNPSMLTGTENSEDVGSSGSAIHVMPNTVPNMYGD